VFFLWDLFYRKKVNIEDLNRMFELLRGYNLDLGTSLATTRPHWGVFNAIRSPLNVSMLMLVVDAIVKKDLVPPEDLTRTIELAKLVLGIEKEENEKEENEEEKNEKEKGKTEMDPILVSTVLFSIAYALVRLYLAQ
jgi:hypothetical protein